MDIGTIIDRYHSARVALQILEDEEAAVLGQNHPELDAGIVKAMTNVSIRKSSPEVVAEFLEAWKEYEKAHARLRVREVEAYERATAWAVVSGAKE